MKNIKEISGNKFEFWSGGKDTARFLTEKEIEQVFYILEECYPEGMDETEINDFFWYEDDTIAEWLGYESFEQIMDERKELI